MHAGSCLFYLPKPGYSQASQMGSNRRCQSSSTKHPDLVSSFMTDLLHLTLNGLCIAVSDVSKPERFTFFFTAAARIRTVWKVKDSDVQYLLSFWLSDWLGLGTATCGWGYVWGSFSFSISSFSKQAAKLSFRLQKWPSKQEPNWLLQQHAPEFV